MRRLMTCRHHPMIRKKMSHLNMMMTRRNMSCWKNRHCMMIRRMIWGWSTNFHCCCWPEKNSFLQVQSSWVSCMFLLTLHCSTELHFCTYSMTLPELNNQMKILQVPNNQMTLTELNNLIQTSLKPVQNSCPDLKAAMTACVPYPGCCCSLDFCLYSVFQQTLNYYMTDVPAFLDYCSSVYMNDLRCCIQVLQMQAFVQCWNGRWLFPLKDPEPWFR
jgi:hypothetical protein